MSLKKLHMLKGETNTDRTTYISQSIMSHKSLHVMKGSKKSHKTLYVKKGVIKSDKTLYVKKGVIKSDKNLYVAPCSTVYSSVAICKERCYIVRQIHTCHTMCTNVWKCNNKSAAINSAISICAARKNSTRHKIAARHSTTRHHVAWYNEQGTTGHNMASQDTTWHEAHKQTTQPDSE